METGVAFLGVRDPDLIRADLENLESEGYTYIWHPYSESDFQYYRDTMGEIINLSAEHGLQVIVSPWAIGRVFDGKAFSEFAARCRSSSQINNHGNCAPATCINNPEFQQYMRDWVKSVCETEVKTILWDNPHFFYEEGGELWCCTCESCQKLFRKKTRHLMPNSLTKSVREFRIASVCEFLAELTGLVHTMGKRNLVCSSFLEGENGLLMEDIAELPTVDEIGLKPYWKRGEKPGNISKVYHEQSSRLLDLTKKYEKDAVMFIKNFSIQKNNEDSVAQATYAAFNEGIRNLIAFAYKGTHCLSAFRSDDPEKVWKTQTEAFAECHDKAILNEMIDTIRSDEPE
jgi:hypothetical protein